MVLNVGSCTKCTRRLIRVGTLSLNVKGERAADRARGLSPDNVEREASIILLGKVHEAGGSGNV